MEISFKEDSTIPKQRLYPIPNSLMEELYTQIQQLLNKGFIEPSQSPYGSPVLFTRKKTGGWRLCIDYRLINQITIKDDYPLPRISELLEKTRKAHWLSKLDLLHGYHQLRISKKDADKTTFKCQYGSYKFVVVPFGLSNAPSVFQRFMDNLFKLETLKETLLIYLDDLLLMTESTSIEDHIKYIYEIFEILKKNHLQVNLDKCIFLVRQVDYLGHMIGYQKIEPLEEKIDSIANWRTPTNKEEVKSFIGLVNYYHRFIPNLATIQAPLTSLLRKNVIFKWTEEEQEAFDTIKQKMKERPSLFPPDYKLPFYFDCDASNKGIGYVLYQMVKKEKQIICFGSRKLKDSEISYSTLEKELLSIVTALKSNYYQVFGHEIIINTDHKNITYIKEASRVGINHVVNRWLAHINLYQPKIKFIPDKKVKEGILDGIEDFTVVNGIRYNSEDKIIVPRISSIINSLLYRHHDSEFAAHQSYEKTLASIAEIYYWKDMERDIRRYCQDCIVCTLGSDHTHKRIGTLQPISTPSKCFSRIHVDFITGLTAVDYFGIQANGIMVVVDALSKMVRLIPFNNKSNSRDIIKLFHKEIFKLHGIPIQLISDSDSKFTAKLFKQFTQLYGITHGKSTPAHQQANGQVERTIRTLKNIIRKLLQQDKMNNINSNWSSHLDTVEFALNSTVSSTTGYSPFKIYHGFNPLSPLNVIKESNVKFNEGTDEELERMVMEKRNIIKLVKWNISLENYQMRLNYNKDKKENQIKVGDFVFIRNNRGVIGKKMDAIYTGPYKVIEMDGLNVTVVERKNDKHGKLVDKKITVHVKYIQPYSPSTSNMNQLEDPVDGLNDPADGLVDCNNDNTVESTVTHTHGSQGTRTTTNLDVEEDIQDMDIDQENEPDEMNIEQDNEPGQDTVEDISNLSNLQNNSGKDNLLEQITTDLDHYLGLDSSYHDSFNSVRGIQSNMVSKKDIMEIEDNVKMLIKHVKNNTSKLNQIDIQAVNNIVKFMDSSDFIQNTPSNEICKDIERLANSNWNDKMYIILAKRKFFIGSSKKPAVEYLVKFGKVMAWIKLDNARAKKMEDELKERKIVLLTRVGDELSHKLPIPHHQDTHLSLLKRLDNYKLGNKDFPLSV